MLDKLIPDYVARAPGTPAYRSAWDETIEAAEKYNEPGRFTALIGRPYTLTGEAKSRKRERSTN